MTRGDAGFSLPEVMAAGMLSLCLALPAFALLRRTYDLADLMQSRFRMNGQARQAFALLADGGASTAAGQVNARGFALVEGLRSRQSLPTASTLRVASQLVLPDGLLTLAGDAIPGLSVTCTGAQLPVPGCTAAGTLAVHGWLGQDPTLARTPALASSRNAGLGLTVTDPFRAGRARLAPASATEQYRTIFTLNAEAAP